MLRLLTLASVTSIATGALCSTFACAGDNVVGGDQSQTVSANLVTCNRVRMFQQPN